VIDRITVVALTEHLKTQWADAARAGIPIDLDVLRPEGPHEQGLRRGCGHLRRVAVNALRTGSAPSA
jgi:hypothetical protein